MAPEDFYRGGVILKVAGAASGTKWERAGLLVPNLPEDWELIGPLCRISPTGTNGRIGFEVYTSAWTTTGYAIEWRDSTGETASDWTGLRVIRNLPEVVSIELTRPGDTTISQGGPPLQTLTLTLWRHPSPRFDWRFTQEGATGTLRAAVVSGVGTAGSTGYIYRSANDGNGDRWVLGILNGSLSGASSGYVERASATELVGWAGLIEGWSTATGFRDPDRVEEAFYAATAIDHVGVAG
jgi:hypothetical protein